MDKDKSLIEFGARLRMAREEKKISQMQLADMIGTTKSAISAYENGMTNPGLNIFIEMARTLGVSMQWLGTGKESIELGEDAEKAQKIIEYKKFLDHVEK